MGQPAQAASARAPIRLAEQRSLESLPVLGAHQVVEHRVEGGGEEVEAAGEVEEVLVDRPEVLVLSEVHVTQPLEVKRRPGDKEENNHRNCGDINLNILLMNKTLQKAFQK